MERGTLYIVATPIGNLEDITYRAVRILREVDLIAAEDTRHSRKLLAHFGISRPLTSYYDHNQNVKGEVVINKLLSGQNVALITDAGTPCISDPGYQLVLSAVNAGVRVVPVPGASAAIAALSVAGLPTDAFVFEGFLPARQGKRKDKLQQLRQETRVIIFYESPRRLQSTLADIASILDDRNVVIARELTKIHEEFLRGSVSAIIEQLADREIRGEVVILVAPEFRREEKPELSLEKLLMGCLFDKKMTLKDAVKLVAQETGAPRSSVYAEALALRQKSPEC